jgi:hypothetical protein
MNDNSLNSKLPLPKINFNNQEKYDKENEHQFLNEKKLPDEKKYKLVYLDDDYAKVETIKLKPKANNNNSQTNQSSQNMFRKSAMETSHTSSFINNNNNNYSSNYFSSNINNYSKKRPETIDIKGK